MVLVEDLQVNYRQAGTVTPVLDGLSFRLEEGSTCALIGPSGCGKSTLLLVLAGLLKAGEGADIKGRKVSPQPQDIALILQDYGLLPWKTVSDNVGLGLEIRKVDAAERREKVKQCLQEVGLWEQRNRFPSQLSGGQRQRVAIARCLALNPSLFLMDEPFSSLDALTREDMQNTLLDIQRKKKISVILVTHSIEEAVFLGQQIIVLTPAPARVFHILENNEAGDRAFRQRQLFYKRCSQVRRLLERGMADEPEQEVGSI